MLQTAASIENLAITVYKKALTLPAAVSGAANPVIAAFVTTTIKQHTDHAQAFNAAALALHGTAQTDVDHKVLDSVVTPALTAVKGPGDVVGLAITLEDAAAQTYVKFGGAVADSNARKPFASIAPVEAQHAAVLRAVKALLDAGAPQLVALPPDLGKLPAAAGDVAFRDSSFYPTSAARPASEGVVAPPSPSATGQRVRGHQQGRQEHRRRGVPAEHGAGGGHHDRFVRHSRCLRRREHRQRPGREGQQRRPVADSEADSPEGVATGRAPA
jgi:hypothetical protein